MEHSDLPNPQKVSARRRLIRGAFSAPALMTVCSGSAFAQASNMRCLSNAANHTGTPPAAWGTPGPDSFLRVQLWRVTTRTCDRDGGGNCAAVVNTFYVRGSDLSVYSRASGMPTNTQYLEINPTSYVTSSTLVSPPLASVDSGTNPVRRTMIVSEGQTMADQSTVSSPYVAVRFNSSGVIVGVGAPGTGGGGMVGTSCWTSAFPAPRP